MLCQLVCSPSVREFEKRVGVMLCWLICSPSFREFEKHVGVILHGLLDTTFCLNSLIYPQVGPHKAPRVRVGLLQTRLVPGYYHGNRARQLMHIVSDDLSGSTSHIHSSSSHSYQHMFHRILILHLIYISKCVSWAV